MLVGSGNRSSQNPLVQIGGVTSQSTNRGNWTKPGQLMCFGQGGGGQLDGSSRSQTAKAGFPNGHTHPSSWMLPMKGGGMSAYKSINGAGSLNAANLLMGRALSAELTGSGDISAANLALIVSLSAALAGAGSLTASLKGAVQLAAELAGEGDITAALGAIVSMSATLEGDGDITATLRGTASLSAEILSYGELTPEGLRDAVWGALLEAGLTAQDLLRLAAAAAAGKLSGAEGTDVVIRNVSDTADIITATVDSNGNRTAVVLDLD
jgi:hypothetical protein